MPRLLVSSVYNFAVGQRSRHLGRRNSEGSEDVPGTGNAAIGDAAIDMDVGTAAKFEMGGAFRCGNTCYCP